MPPADAVPGLLLATAGAVAVLAGLTALRASGASPGMARRLAGARGVRVGELLDGEPPPRPVRVAGRVRCSDPLVAAGGERLVAFHRDVEVRVGRRWRTIERVRETRAFDLWDHDGSLRLDPSRAAEPLVAIPRVWRGSSAELEEPLRSAARRLTPPGEDGAHRPARALTRTLSVTDRLLVLAAVERGGDGLLRLAPPPGGYVVSALPLDAAMRLLGGARPRLLLVAVVTLGLGALTTAAGLILVLAAALTVA